MSDTVIRWVAVSLILFGIICYALLFYRLIKKFDTVFSRLEAVELAAENLKKSRDDATIEAVTGVLTDPDRLDAELDRSGQLSEMRRAKRRHLPRENAGPPAKVRQMRFSRKES